jgi:molybdenum cofactor biosynthesis enzyme
VARTAVAAGETRIRCCAMNTIAENDLALGHYLAAAETAI